MAYIIASNKEVSDSLASDSLKTIIKDIKIINLELLSMFIRHFRRDPAPHPATVENSMCHDIALYGIFVVRKNMACQNASIYNFHRGMKLLNKRWKLMNRV